MMSVAPPGGNGTIQRTGFCGNDCASAVLAADVRAGLAQLVADAVGERHAWLDFRLDTFAIQDEGDFHSVLIKARSSSVPASARR